MLFYTFNLSEIKHTHLHGTPFLHANDLQVTYACKADKIAVVESFITEDAFKIANYCQRLGLRLN